MPIGLCPCPSQVLSALNLANQSVMMIPRYLTGPELEFQNRYQWGLYQAYCQGLYAPLSVHIDSSRICPSLAVCHFETLLGVAFRGSTCIRRKSTRAAGTRSPPSPRRAKCLWPPPTRLPARQLQFLRRTPRGRNHSRSRPRLPASPSSSTSARCQCPLPSPSKRRSTYYPNLGPR